MLCFVPSVCVPSNESTLTYTFGVTSSATSLEWKISNSKPLVIGPKAPIGFQFIFGLPSEFNTFGFQVLVKLRDNCLANTPKVECDFPQSLLAGSSK